jgi:hypothetical protein
MELIFLVGLVAVVVWSALIVWKWWTREQRSEKAAEKATVEQAWHIVLADPHYGQRRQYEEHKQKVEAQLRKEAEDLGDPPPG